MQSRFGASLSIKQCRNFGVNPLAVLRWGIKDMGITRYRLMSYWNEHEKEQGVYDFKELDAQVKYIQKHGGTISMCLGVRQPRWPESHWPNWTKTLTVQERKETLEQYIKTVVTRYKKYSCIVEWQLENEALLKSFGHDGDFDRKRLRDEYALVKRLDDRPIVMTTSTSWGVPMRRPIPNRVGFSYYRIVHNKGEYRKSIYQPAVFSLRAALVKILHSRPSFIHELQAEPWGPKNIWEMSDDEQAISMSLDTLRKNIMAAKATGLYPIDLWGIEWWYWQKTAKDNDVIWSAVKHAIN
jgi:hypothetical protein